MIKKTDFKNKTEQELKAFILEQEKKLQDLNFDLRLGKLQNTSQIAKAKKEIARAKTFLRLKN